MWVVIAVTFLVTFIISWQAYRCQTYVSTCDASRTAQISVSAGNNNKADTEKEKSQEETPGACANANRYLCLILTPANMPAIYLVILGLGGVIVGMGTLGVIEKQTHVMERQTTALIEGQRPMVYARCHGDATATFADREARRIELALENKGQHRARDLVYETWIEILPFPFVDFTEAATKYKSINPITLYPGDTNFIVNIPIQREVTEEEWAAIRRLMLHVCVRIRISYRDAFGQTTADFGYYVTPRGMSYLTKYNNMIQNNEPN